MQSIRLAITGATGFIGTALYLKVVNHYSTLVLGRSPKSVVSKDSFVHYDLANPTDVTGSLDSVDVVIHSAAIAQIAPNSTQAELDYFYKVNTDSVVALATSAVKAGVRRFIFVSSLKAMGESTSGRKPFCVGDELGPQDPYGISKAKAEKALLDIADETGLEVVIIRPPIVYGPGVKGNFASLQRIANKNLPLPLGAINNVRSLVALDNLIDLIFTCIEHPAAANQIFLVSDDQDVSTTELISMMTRATGKIPRLLPFPDWLFKWVGKLTGKQAFVERLCGNLCVDISHTKSKLNWVPIISVEEGIRRSLKI